MGNRLINIINFKVVSHFTLLIIDEVIIFMALSYLYNVSTDYLLGRQAADPHTLVDISKLTDKQKAAVTSLIESIISPWS